MHANILATNQCHCSKIFKSAEVVDNEHIKHVSKIPTYTHRFCLIVYKCMYFLSCNENLTIIIVPMYT